MPRERLYWISESGISTDLTDWENYFALRERMGFWSPQYLVRGFEIPGQAGSVVQTAKAMNRMIEVPMVIRDTSNNTLRERLRELSHLLIASNGDGQLVSVDEDGAKRIINCRYLRGLESGKEMPASLNCTLTFQANDPFWYEDMPDTLSISGGTGQSYWFPIFPLKLSNSLVLGTVTWTNLGDEEAWPTWTILGPASQIKISNVTTGKELEFVNYTLTDNSKRININTFPGTKTVKDQDGTNIFGYLSSTSSLFPIAVGTNTLSITVTGSTTSTVVRGRIWPRYLSA